MALRILEAPDMSWRATFDHEGARDRFNRKLAQAEALSSLLYGGGGESFRACNDVIQDNTLWLLADLITEIRQAREAEDAAAGAKS